MKIKKSIFVSIIVLIIFLLGIVVFLRFYPSIRTGKEISALLQPILNAENQSMDFQIKTDSLGEDLEIDAQIYLVKQNDRRYLVAEQNGHPFYLTDGVLYLENAKAFRLIDEMEDGAVLAENLSNKNLFLQIAGIYEAVDISCSKEGTKTEYSATITGKQAEELLTESSVAEKMDLSEMDTLRILLEAEEGQLERIRVLISSAKIDESAIEKTSLDAQEKRYIEIELSDFRILETGVYKIPSEIELAAATVNKEELFSLSGDLYRLLLAFGEFFEQEKLSGSIELRANCGRIQFQNTYDLAQLSMTEGLENAKEIKGLPEMVAFLCMEGTIRCTKNGASYMYELKLEEDSMEQLAEVIVPQIVNQVISFQTGSIRIGVEEGQIQGMEISIGGEVPVLFSKVNAEIGAKFDFLVE